MAAMYDVLPLAASHSIVRGRVEPARTAAIRRPELVRCLLESSETVSTHHPSRSLLSQFNNSLRPPQLLQFVTTPSHGPQASLFQLKPEAANSAQNHARIVVSASSFGGGCRQGSDGLIPGGAGPCRGDVVGSSEAAVACDGSTVESGRGAVR